MDIATIIGIVGGAAMIVMSVITSGGTMGGIIDVPSMAMTIGGSYFALYIGFPLSKALGLFKVMGRAFKVPDFGEKQIVQNLVALSEKARSPIIGLSGFVLTSAQGAKFKFIP